MLRTTGIFILCAYFLCGTFVEARVLELLPQYRNEESRLRLGWRSDLWGDPNYSKYSPVRLYDVNTNPSFYRTAEQNAFFKLNMDGLSSGRSDFTVGRGRTLIGSDLRSQEVGLGYVKNQDRSSWYSLSAEYASDSDHPYQELRSRWAELSGTYAFAKEKNWQWVVLVNYSKNRGYLNNQVIPLVGGIYQFENGWTMTVGLPFLKLEKKFDPWSYLFVATATGVRGRVTKKINDLFIARGEAGYSTRSYLHINRTEDDMRLFYEEKYAQAQLVTALSKNVNMTFFAGYSMDRNFYEAKQIYLANRTRTKLQNDWFGGFVIEVKL